MSLQSRPRSNMALIEPLERRALMSALTLDQGPVDVWTNSQPSVATVINYAGENNGTLANGVQLAANSGKLGGAVLLGGTNGLAQLTNHAGTNQSVLQTSVAAQEMLTLSPLQALTPVQLASSLLSASVYEAEDAARSGAQVSSSNPGYSGTGYVDFNYGAGGDTGAYIEWTVNVAAQGTYLLEIRHANGAAADRTLEMAVNGVTVRSKQSYKPTGSWSNWAISNDKVVLNAGDNTIRVTTIGLNGGNIDYLEVTQALYEAESATASQASTSSSNPGYSGTGYRDYSGNTGAYIEWTVDVPSAGNYALEFIYANGAASSRPLEIKVNGNVVNSSLAFNPTGNWTTWLTSATTTALLEGANTIRATTIGANGANVDYLLLRKAVAGEVYLNVGDNFQSVVNNNPAGTTYIIKSGVHRQQSVIAKNGDTFLGEYGAVLNGAKVLSASAFQTDQNGRYFISGQPGDNWAFGKIKAGGNARDAYREELFVNGYTRLKHVGSIAELGPGKWFYDYPNQRIYMYDNPASFSSVEISKERGAFGGHEVSGVTIENLIIEKYATPAQHGAISFHTQHYTQNWIVRYVEARYNHGAGISLAPGMTIENSKVHSNGQIGIRGVGRVDDPNRPSYGYTAYVILRNTEIYNNKVLDYDWGWEGGGTKFLYTDAGMLVENNWVHDNIGPGIWFDAYNYNATIRSNLTENNHSMGIFYEISYGPTKIYWNIVRNNGIGGNGNAGIFISGSRDVEVYENVVYGPKDGIWALHSTRSPGLYNVNIHHNDISMDTEWGVFMKLQDESGDPTYDLASQVTVDNNIYRGFSTKSVWYWKTSRKNFSDWNALGFDINGQLLPLGTPVLPAYAKAYVLSHYGQRR